MKGFTAAQSHYDNMMPEDDKCPACVDGKCETHDVYEIENRLKDLGYDIEVIDVGLTVIRKGKIKFFGTEEQVLNWLEENEEI